MRQVPAVLTCLAAWLLEGVFEGVSATGRSFSEVGGLRSSVSGGVTSPAEMEEQEEDMEVLEEASPSVPSVPLPKAHQQAFLQSPAFVPATQDPAVTSFAPLTSKHSDAKVPSTARPSKGDLVLPLSPRKPAVAPPRNASARDEAILMQAPVKTPWPPPSKRTKCHPECMEGRGTCNDNVCFCKSPYTGVSCQHKISDLARFPIPVVIAFGAVSLVLGSVFARIVYWIPPEYCCLPSCYSRAATKDAGTLKKEVWQPPSVSSKAKTANAGPKPDQPPADAHAGDHDHT